jgi:hypothetical protein
MQIVENWSRVSGCVDAWMPPSAAGRPGTLTVRVSRVAPIAREDGSLYPNLLSGAEGRLLRIEVPAVAADRLAPSPGADVELDVRRGRTAERLFAHPERIRLAG